MKGLLKPNRVEAAFFGVVFVAFPLLTDIEYYVNEGVSPRSPRVLVLERLLYGCLAIVPYWLYYRLVLPLLFERRPGPFGGRLVVFLLLLNAYQHYLVHGLVMHSWFLPDSMIAAARRWYDASVFLHFGVIYVLRQLLVVTALGYYHHSVRQQRRIAALGQHQLQTELASLKAQLQPHYFFNTLNNIYSLALQGSPETAPLIARHADIMRYVLHQARHQTVSLPEEIAFLTNYIAVESVRFSAQHTIQLDTQGIHDGVVIEPLLLLPFVENTVKHGLHQETATGLVHILIILLGRELILETRNTKLSRVAAADPSGIGLGTARKRLALLYPGCHQLRIEEDETTYKLQLCLTLRPHA